jgi:hypothetical protein
MKTPQITLECKGGFPQSEKNGSVNYLLKQLVLKLPAGAWIRGSTNAMPCLHAASEVI